ncbi:probable glutamate receptor [Penaeus chinensis]|uniref:probable glutamate receptor n=1 Tax=Penaeus chinensis TaxID=139456 RepID=UPI001FB7E902|nr:probable glutamate receptor [Penaeus chinensis]
MRTQAQELSVPEVYFIQDYVEFYNIKHICILQEELKPWILKLLRQTRSGSFVSVFGRKDTTRSRVHINGSSSASPVAHRVSTCTGLRVLAVHSELDRDLFKEIFTGAETKANWLLISGENFQELLENAYLPLDNQVKIANFSDVNDRSSATLWESYQIGPNYDQHLTPVGRWTLTTRDQNDPSNNDSSDDHDFSGDSKGFRGESPSPPASREIAIPNTVSVKTKVLKHGVLEGPVDDLLFRRTDLSGLHVTCTSIDYKPLNIITHREDGTIHVKGILGKIFDMLREVTNFTYTCYEVPDNQWGSLADGQWTGLVGEVASGRADLAIASLTISKQRSTVVDFLISLAVSGYRIAMKRPSNADYMWTVYTKQFEKEAWAVTVSVTVVLMVLVFVVLRLSRREENASPSISAFTVLGILFGQGSILEFRSLAGRILMVSVLFLQVIILAFYTSNLVTALAVRPSPPPFQGLEDVHQDPMVTFGIEKGTALDDIFENSKNPLYQAIYQKLKPEDTVASTTDGMRRVFRERYAFLIWELYYDLNHQGGCDNYLLPQKYFTDHASFILTKGSPLTPIFNNVILDLASSGLLSKFWLEVKVTTNDCDDLETASLEFLTLVTSFLVLCVGAVAALGFLGAEWVLSRRPWEKFCGKGEG